MSMQQSIDVTNGLLLKDWYTGPKGNIGLKAKQNLYWMCYRDMMYRGTIYKALRKVKFRK